MNNRKVVFQYLRVIATIIVVLGHAIIIYDNSWGVYTTTKFYPFFYYLKKVINVIQMPIFFIISGYLFNLSIKKYDKFKILFKEKFLRLIVPLVFIGYCWMIPIRTVIHYNNYFVNGTFNYSILYRFLLGIDLGHLWFVYVLFLIFIIFYLLNKIIKIQQKHLIIIIIALLLNVFSHKMPALIVINCQNYFPLISQVYMYLFYFSIGFYCKNLIDKIKLFSYKSILKLCLILSTTILTYLIIYTVENLIIENIFSIIVNICFFLFLYLTFVDFKENNFIRIIDKNSFIIYLLHPPIMYIIFKYFGNINPIILISANIFISTIISLLIANILRRLKINFIIGESNNKKIKLCDL